MTGKYHDPGEGNRRYQRAMAQALVAGLGHDAAFEASAGNGWEGVVKVLLPPRRGSREAGSGENPSSNEDKASSWIYLDVFCRPAR